MPTDEIEKYVNNIVAARYYVETTEAFALEGKGWYCDSLTKKTLQYKLITEEYIKYQLKTSLSVKQNHFKQFVLDVYDKSECHKQAINGYWFTR